MSVDWGQAAQIGGVGFGLVFLVLIVLALALWLTGFIFRKIESGKEKPAETKKGA
jgi:Na+-transporting methylmalonyl-CoA/oxaloacetate decarboxylase gamma subunit